MAFTAKIESITAIPDITGVAVTWLVSVMFNDSITGFTSIKTYSFPMNTTQSSAAATITADGNSLKAALATASTLQGKIGTVITI